MKLCRPIDHLPTNSDIGPTICYHTPGNKDTVQKTIGNMTTVLHQTYGHIDPPGTIMYTVQCSLSTDPTKYVDRVLYYSRCSQSSTVSCILPYVDGSGCYRRLKSKDSTTGGLSSRLLHWPASAICCYTALLLFFHHLAEGFGIHSEQTYIILHSSTVSHCGQLYFG